MAQGFSYGGSETQGLGAREPLNRGDLVEANSEGTRSERSAFLEKLKGWLGRKGCHTDQIWSAKIIT